ncbi:MAG: hypothetical protein KF703_09940 [Actinobacteria bacterium]|nr:hypothetical protein [Actinomycetota bacterium]
MRPRPVPSATRRLGAVVAAVALATAGCGLFGDDEPSGSAPTTSTTAPVTSTTVPETMVEVLDTGTPPLAPLRLSFREGDTTTLSLTIDLDVTQTSGSARQELVTPTVREVATLTVDGVDDGEAMVSLAFTEANVVRTDTDLTDQEAAELDAALAALVGIRASGRVTELGEVSSFRYDLPDDLDPAVATTLERTRDQLDAAVVPLPGEPVGVGARWRATTTSRVGGFPLRQETTYELTEVGDGTIAYTAEVRQSAEDQDVALDGLPQGTTAHLVSSRVEGSATGTMDLGSVAAEARSSLAGTQVIDIRQRGAADRRLTQELALSVVVEPG